MMLETLDRSVVDVAAARERSTSLRVEGGVRTQKSGTSEENVLVGDFESTPV